MALVSNSYVKRLHLDRNGILDKGAGLLSYTIQQNKTLQFISLNDNHIQSAGAQAIAAALHENTTLQTLRMENNFIGNHGARSLRKMMRHNNTLKELHLDGNTNISSKIISKFKADTRVRIEYRMDENEHPCDATAGTSGTYSSSGTYTSSGTEETPSTRHPRNDLIKEESKPSTETEWAASSALSLNASAELASSLFGSSMYLNNDDALKYILGRGDSIDQQNDAGSSYVNLASYMMTLNLDQNEEEDEVLRENGLGKKSEEELNLSLLSVAASEPDEAPAADGKPKKNLLSHIPMFKKTKSNRKIHDSKNTRFDSY